MDQHHKKRVSQIILVISVSFYFEAIYKISTLDTYAYNNGSGSFNLHRNVAVLILLFFVIANGFEHNKFTCSVFLIAIVMAIVMISFKINPSYEIKHSNKLVLVVIGIF